MSICADTGAFVQSNLAYPDPAYPEIPLSGRDLSGTDFFHYICTRLSGNSRFRIRTGISEPNVQILCKIASHIRNPDHQQQSHLFVFYLKYTQGPFQWSSV